MRALQEPGRAVVDEAPGADLVLVEQRDDGRLDLVLVLHGLAVAQLAGEVAPVP